jgi:adenylosuccinate synthase
MKSICVLGMGFGDEGKGTVVDYLCNTVSNPRCVVRFNGGPQAAHNVVTNDGKHHTFSQFGSGTLAGVPTYIDREVVIEPAALYNEAEHLKELGVKNPLERLRIHRGAIIVTPYHKAVNRLREIARGSERHGSCGMGVGEARKDACDGGPTLQVLNLCGGSSRLRERLANIRIHNLRKANNLAKIHGKSERFKQELDALNGIDLDLWLDFYMHFPNDVIMVNSIQDAGHSFGDGTYIYEGAQGCLLDQTYGFGVHKTFTNCYPTNAFLLNRELGDIFAMRSNQILLGVIRPYTTRHGAGPLPTEDKELTKKFADSHNGNNTWQGEFRVGAFDLPLFNYVKGCLTGMQNLSGLVVTHLDKPIDKICERYSNMNVLARNGDNNLNPESNLSLAIPEYTPTKFRDEFYAKLGIPVVLESFGPTSADKRRTPHWRKLSSI